MSLSDEICGFNEFGLILCIIACALSKQMLEVRIQTNKILIRHPMTAGWRRRAGTGVPVEQLGLQSVLF
jgi:hypothetical protein